MSESKAGGPQTVSESSSSTNKDVNNNDSNVAKAVAQEDGGDSVSRKDESAKQSDIGPLTTPMRSSLDFSGENSLLSPLTMSQGTLNQRLYKQSLTVYGVAPYTFGVKAEQPSKDVNSRERQQRMATLYGQLGIRRSVGGVLLVHQHGHPHVLLLEVTCGGEKEFILPGGRLRPGEDEIEGLSRKLTRKLVPDEVAVPPKWDVHSLLSVWLCGSLCVYVPVYM